MPDTPEKCIDLVAGKVIQLENLHDEIEKATNFMKFFSNFYCSAYVNSLVTMKDGLYAIFPGVLDSEVDTELQRAFGPFEADQKVAIEEAAIATYKDALNNGSFKLDNSVLLPETEPLTAALKLCVGAVNDEAIQAKKDRDEYLNDYNFLRFLQTM